ncbi:MAG: hypothetical protein NTX22_00630 [Ignavibacteriales bacterium]|nr:hypothetical protein [Ignavibacteriales bacterium]
MKVKFDFEQTIFEFLGKEEILSSRKTDTLKYLEKHFKNYNAISSRAFDNLENIVLQKPQIVIDILNETFTSDIYTTILASVNKQEECIYKKISIISMHWEIASLYKFASYLLSDFQAPLISLNEKTAVFSHLRAFGLDSKTIEEMRIIRNGKNHRFTVKSSTIVAICDNKETEISFVRIEDIYKKLELFSSWWLTFITLQFLFIPKYGVLASYAFFMKAKKNLDFLKEYGEGLITVFPNLKDTIKNKNQLSLKGRFQKYFRKIKYKFFNLFNSQKDYQRFFIENKEYIFSRLKYHSEGILNYLQNIIDNLEKEEDINNLKKIKDWFQNAHTKLSNINLDDLEKFYMEKLRKKNSNPLIK